MTEQTQASEITLEIVDIANATQIMKAAIERGVFQAEEMSGVASVYDKFRVAVAQIQASAASEEAPVAETDAE